jgi:hypothetical protein
MIDWHPEDPATLADPYDVFTRLRDEDPCHWSPRLKSWVLTRYDDVKAVCLDKERLSSDRLRPFFASLPSPEAERIGQIIRYLSQWMVFKDPPDHTRVRARAKTSTDATSCFRRVCAAAASGVVGLQCFKGTCSSSCLASQVNCSKKRNNSARHACRQNQGP